MSQLEKVYKKAHRKKEEEEFLSQSFFSTIKRFYQSNKSYLIQSMEKAPRFGDMFKPGVFIFRYFENNGLRTWKCTCKVIAVDVNKASIEAVGTINSSHVGATIDMICIIRKEIEYV